MSGIVLASGSAARRHLLERAGVAVRIDVPAIDEAEVKHSLQADGATAADVAETLAEMKAQRISRRLPEALVLGADQMLVCGRVWFDKPESRDGARAQLIALRGQRHELISSAVAVRNGVRLWHHTARVGLTMRSFTDAFLDDYLDRAGGAVLTSVGAYHVEGLGAQLFAAIDGDIFAIMGLPLLPVLDFLREQGELPQ